jgi:hypothetical protein
VASKAELLVADIRATRARLAERVNRFASLDRLADEVRARPMAWIGGGLLAGAVVGRIWGGSLLRMGRLHAEEKLRSKLQMGLGAALLGALGPRLGGSRPAAPRTEDARDGGGTPAA